MILILLWNHFHHSHDIVMMIIILWFTQSDDETDSLFEVLVADTSVIPRVAHLALSEVEARPNNNGCDRLFRWDWEYLDVPASLSVSRLKPGLSFALTGCGGEQFIPKEWSYTGCGGGNCYLSPKSDPNKWSYTGCGGEVVSSPGFDQIFTVGASSQPSWARPHYIFVGEFALQNNCYLYPKSEPNK